jgi:flavin-dependent dehydrogenase
MYYFRGGYCGLAPVEDGLVNACCLVHRERAGDLQATRDFAGWMCRVSGSRALRQRLAGGEQATDTVCTVPVRLAQRAATLDNVLLAGDAAGFLDPFAGDGLACAMLSGALAANVIADGLARGDGTAAIARRYAAQLGQAMGQSYRSTAWLRALVVAPSFVQSLGAKVLLRPVLAQRLVHRTRWQLRAGGAESTTWG